MFQYGNGVGVYLPASALLPFLGVCLERLVIAVLVQRADTGFFQAGYDVAGCYPRTMHACFASLQFVIGQKLHNGFCGSTVDALQSFSSGDCACSNRAENRKQAVPKNTLCMVFRFSD